MSKRFEGMNSVSGDFDTITVGGLILKGKCHCVKSGFVWDDFYAKENCPDCHGTGSSITYDGEKLLEFVKRYG